MHWLVLLLLIANLGLFIGGWSQDRPVNAPPPPLPPSPGQIQLLTESEGAGGAAEVKR